MAIPYCQQIEDNKFTRIWMLNDEKFRAYRFLTQSLKRSQVGILPSWPWVTNSSFVVKWLHSCKKVNIVPMPLTLAGFCGKLYAFFDFSSKVWDCFRLIAIRLANTSLAINKIKTVVRAFRLYAQPPIAILIFLFNEMTQFRHLGSFICKNWTRTEILVQLLHCIWLEVVSYEDTSFLVSPIFRIIMLKRRWSVLIPPLKMQIARFTDQRLTLRGSPDTAVMRGNS